KTVRAIFEVCIDGDDWNAGVCADRDRGVVVIWREILPPPLRRRRAREWSREQDRANTAFSRDPHDLLLIGFVLADTDSRHRVILLAPRQLVGDRQQQLTDPGAHE